MKPKSKVLSANSLFHFTPKMEYLISILDNGIHPRYCLEDISPFTPETIGLKEVAQPMACFCDIPISGIHHHVHKYGEYGIGLKKDWGMRKGISPVMYVYPHAVSSDLVRLVFYKAWLESMKTEAYNNVIGPLHALKNYFKVSEGQMFINGEFSDEHYNFYDEREWRYVPVGKLAELGSNDKSARAFLIKDEFINSDVKEYHNLLIADHCTLYFEPNDIKYLFVSKESEIIMLIEYLENDFIKRYPKNDIRLLLNKIISVEKLLEDV